MHDVKNYYLYAWEKTILTTTTLLLKAVFFLESLTAYLHSSEGRRIDVESLVKVVVLLKTTSKLALQGTFFSLVYYNVYVFTK